MEKIKIETDYIKLDQFLKLAGVVQTGGQGKMLILEKNIMVNDQVCTQRGKKLRKDDIIEIKGYQSYIVV